MVVETEKWLVNTGHRPLFAALYTYYPISEEVKGIRQ